MHLGAASRQLRENAKLSMDDIEAQLAALGSAAFQVATFQNRDVV